MKVDYDIRFNIGYIRFKEKTDKVNSFKISEDLVVDMGEDGSIYGIELLNLKEQLFGDKLSEVVLHNENSGNKLKIELPS
jgi:uncharacterized protein YuzE